MLLVLDASTGQNGLTQARQFTDAVGVTGVVLTKLDGTAKGGIVLAVEAELGVPVKLIGIGESATDLVTLRAARLRRRAHRLMFETLADRFDAIFRRLRSRGRLNEADVDEVAREIRLALLEADVNVRVVKAFVNRLKARATGAEVAESLSPPSRSSRSSTRSSPPPSGARPGRSTRPSGPPR